MNKGRISNEVFNMNKRELNPNQLCQLYACMSWNGMSYKDAKKLVTEKSYEEVDQITYTNSSIETAKAGIEKYTKELNSDKKYYAVIKILEEIHDKWVSENAKKYDRDGIAQDPNLAPEKVDKRLFQHLPTAMIGLEELAKDAMFLEPFLHEQGIDIGKMTNEPYGAFVPNKKIADVYEVYVDVFKEKNNIKEITPTKIQKIIKNYAPLQENTNDFSKPRIDYMNKRAELLARQVENKNPQQFVFQEKENKINFSKLSNKELKQYVKFDFNQEASAANNKIMGDLIPEGGVNLNDALEATKEFLNRNPSLDNIDLKFNEIALNITNDSKVVDLQNEYKNKSHALKENKIDFSKLSNEELKQYVKFDFNQEASAANNKIMGDLIPEGGVNLNDALEAAKEFLNRNPSLDNIDLKFNEIALNVTNDSKVVNLQNEYQNKLHALKEAKKENKIDFSKLSNEELKQYVNFNFNQEASAANNKIMGDLIPEGGVNLDDALEAAKEFLNRNPSLDNIDLKFNEITLNVTNGAKVVDLQNEYKNKLHALKEAKKVKEIN